MAQRKTPAAFERGHTSKGVLFQRKNLPRDSTSVLRTRRRLMDGFVYLP